MREARRRQVEAEWEVEDEDPEDPTREEEEDAGEEEELEGYETACSEPAPQATVARTTQRPGPGSRNLESCMLIQNNACASDPRREPGVVIPLAGICAGGGLQGPFLPRTPEWKA